MVRTVEQLSYKLSRRNRPRNGFALCILQTQCRLAQYPNLSMNPTSRFAPEIQGIRLINGEFFVITADASDGVRYEPLSGLLDRIRRAFEMDVVFVSQFSDGRRLIRYVAAAPDDEFAVPEGASDPLEESYCHKVATGRLPQVIPDALQLPEAAAMEGTHKCRVRAHISVPVVGEDGKVYGTVCCFSHSALENSDGREEFAALSSVAALVASALAP